MTGVLRNMTFKNSITICRAFVLILVLVCISGCSDDHSSKIRVGIPTAPSSLDPRFGSDAVSVRLQQLLHRQLVRFDDEMRPVSDLSVWEVVSPVHYRFHLIGEPKFNDGSRLRAQDVVSTYRSILKPETLSPHLGALQNILSIRAIDLNTVDFHLRQADTFFPETLTIGILSEEDINAMVPFQSQKSSGHFEIAGDINGVTSIRRRKDGVIFEFLAVPDTNARALRLIAGEIDILQGDISPSVYDYLLSQTNLSGMRARGTTFSYLGFNLSEGVAADIKLRRAVSLAINRDKILKFLFHDTARLASTIFPPEHWAGSNSLPRIHFDPESARMLVSQLEEKYGPISLSYKTSTNKFRQRIAAVIQSQLADVGIELEIERLDFATLMRDITKGDFQTYSLSWVGLNSPDMFRQIFHSAATPPAGKNRGRYHSAIADSYIEAGEKESSLLGRQGIYENLELHLLKELPYFPLWFEDQLAIWSNNITGYRVDHTGSYNGLLEVEKI